MSYVTVTLPQPALGAATVPCPRSAATQIVPLLHLSQLYSPLCDKPKSKSLRYIDGSATVEYVSQHQLGVVDRGLLELFTWMVSPQVRSELFVTPTAPVATWAKYGIGEVMRYNVALEVLWASICPPASVPDAVDRLIDRDRGRVPRQISWGALRVWQESHTGELVLVELEAICRRLEPVCAAEE